MRFNGPAVQTNPATNIGAHSARLQGEILSLGSFSSLDVSFEYGQSQGGPYPSSTNPQTKSSVGAFHADIAGIDPETAYYFKAKADDGNFTITITDQVSAHSFEINHVGAISVAPGGELIVTIIVPGDLPWWCNTQIDGDWCAAGPYSWGSRGDDGYSFDYGPPLTQTPGTITITFTNVSSNHTLGIFGDYPI
jgi:hypothetical protein